MPIEFFLLSKDSLVQFKMVYMRSEKIVCAPLRLSDVSPLLALKQFQCSSDWRLPSRPFKEDRLALQSLFPCLSPPCDRWCGVLGFVPTGSVSSSSTLQIFQDASHLWWLLCLPVYLLGRLPSLRYVLGRTPTGVLKDGCRSLTQSSFDPIPFSLSVVSSLNLWGWWHVWLTVASWGNPAEGMGDCFYLHCQAGGWDRMGCTVFMDGGRTLLDSGASSWLVFGDWARTDCKTRLLPKIFILEYRRSIS